MSTQFEDRLRDAMDQATAQLELRPGLAARASQHRQRRRLTARVVTAAGTTMAVAAGLAAAGAAGAFGSSAGTGTQQASYTSYVVRHVESALAAPSQANSVQYARSTYQPGTLLDPAGPFAVRVSHGSPSSPWAVSYDQRWMYHSSARATAYGPSGQAVFGLGATLPAGAVGRSIGVSYVNRTWWQQSLPARPVPSASAPINCGPQIQIPVGVGWAGYIRHQLSCGEYSVAGRQWVDGVDAVKIVSKQGMITLWVNPHSYLPVRLILDLGRINSRTDFRWLPPTPANLAQLTVTVPAGFSQVPPPYTQSQAG